ncbi:MAG: hypothetical protein DID92_2727743023 [Candidatus Nitrotoga sp. SPKER]|nr:MAG: hypothetical protein DID92_2727743023 [Candidatus Nitrotoga sp. SPKER]
MQSLDVLTVFLQEIEGRYFKLKLNFEKFYSVIKIYNESNERSVPGLVVFPLEENEFH